jgi:hypothetical protein
MLTTDTNRTIVICVMEQVYLEEYLVRVAMVRRARLPYSLAHSEICKGWQVLSGVWVAGSFCCKFCVSRLFQFRMSLFEIHIFEKWKERIASQYCRLPTNWYKLT